MLTTPRFAACLLPLTFGAILLMVAVPPPGAAFWIGLGLLGVSLGGYSLLLFDD